MREQDIIKNLTEAKRVDWNKFNAKGDDDPNDPTFIAEPFLRDAGVDAGIEEALVQKIPKALALPGVRVGVAPERLIQTRAIGGHLIWAYPLKLYREKNYPPKQVTHWDFHALPVFNVSIQGDLEAHVEFQYKVGGVVKPTKILRKVKSLELGRIGNQRSGKALKRRFEQKVQVFTQKTLGAITQMVMPLLRNSGK